MERVWIDPRAADLCWALGLRSADALRRLMRIPAEGADDVRVVSRKLPGADQAQTAVFLKRYSHRQRPWKFWLRPSKALREFKNYALFERLGIPCARRIICGETRDCFGRLEEAYIVTEAVPDSMTLKEFALSSMAANGVARRLCVRFRLLRQLAEMTRLLHAAGAFHNDLCLRNVLVRDARGHNPTLVWIDCPRGGRPSLPLFRKRKRIRDLALLLRESTGLCRVSERLWFLQHYFGLRKLGTPQKALIRRITAYKMQRWPEKGTRPGRLTPG